VVVFLWKNLNRLLKPVFSKSIQVPLVETFATFTLLSNVKILGLAVDLLKYTTTHTENGSIEGRYAFFDPSMTYFGKRHISYAIPAIISSILFCFLPLFLLLFYPCRFFQKLLNYSSISFLDF